MATDYDVIIVGARVAGSILATLLGERGQRVLLLDRAHFPSDTLSTHFFRAPAFRSFAAAGVADEVLATAPHLSVNYNVIDGIIFPEPVDGPEDYPFYMCVRRITLDDILVRRARSVEGVDLREGTKVDGLLRDGERVTGVTWRGDSGAGQATARAVVGADGFYSFVAKEVGAEAEQSEPVNRAMYFGYYRDVPPPAEKHGGSAAEFHYRGNNLAYCFPTDGDLHLIAVSVPISRFDDFKGDAEGRFMEEIEALPALGPRVREAQREGPVKGAGNIPGYMRVPYGAGWALVGDAETIMDPWSGQGIDQASTHAVQLAEALGAYLAGDQDWETALSGYHEARNAFSQKAYRSTSRLSRDLTPMTRAALEKRGLA